MLRAISEVIGDYTGLSRKVLEWGLITKRLVDEAKRPGFSVESWAPIREMVAVDEFERVGNFKEVLRWDEYVAFLTKWAPKSDWECSFKRITERPDGVVLIELEERMGGGAVNSLSVYEFDDAGKVRHLDIYLQMPVPKREVLQHYEGIKVSE